MKPDIGPKPFTQSQFLVECPLLKKGWEFNGWLKDGTVAQLQYNFDEKGYPVAMIPPMPNFGNIPINQEITGHQFAESQIQDICWALCPHHFNAERFEGTCLQEGVKSDLSNTAVILATIDFLHQDPPQRNDVIGLCGPLPTRGAQAKHGLITISLYISMLLPEIRSQFIHITSSRRAKKD